MKKLITVVITICMMVGVLAGCGTKTAEATDIVKIGLGHVTSIDSSKDLGTDKDGKEVLPVGQVDTIIVAAAFDKDGKVVKVSIDDAQTKVEFNKDLSLKSDPKAELQTKVEKKEAYGMAKASSIKKEWYQQAEALGNWMIGKTVADIKAVKTKKKDDSHPAVPDVPELTSSVTMTIQDFIAALEEAYTNAVEVKGAVKLGLGHNISIASSKALGKDKDGKEVLPVAQVDTVMAATAFDKDGKVAGTIIDTAQTKINFDNQGKVTSDRKAEYKTKLELKDAYGMVKASSIKKEWYQQAEALGKWMVGKSIDDIKAMKTMKKDDSHPAVPDVPELKSSVTVSVQDYIAAVVEASANAK